ncbi:MAG: hypothetical protein AB1938_02910 [Myxococcota bacterium]
MTPVSDLDELEAALSATERELQDVRAQVLAQRDARAGEQLEKLFAERARVRAEADVLEQANAAAEARLNELSAVVAELEAELAGLTKSR